MLPDATFIRPFHSLVHEENLYNQARTQRIDFSENQIMKIVGSTLDQQPLYTVIRDHEQEIRYLPNIATPVKSV